LDTLVVELLVVAAKLIASACAAVEKLAHHSDRRVRLTLKDGRASKVDGAIKVKVVDIVKELAHQQAWHRFVTDAQHLGSRADRSYVLVTPTNFVIET
jgi:hypothetical protein